MLHRGWNPEGEHRATMHHVTWGADVPVTFDYDPLDDGQLVQILEDHPDMHPAARRYLQTFLDSQREGEQMERKPSIYDMWMTHAETDHFKATVHSTGMGPDGAQPKKASL